MADALNVGVIGYGFATGTFHAPLIAGVAGLRLAAISSSDPAKVRRDWPEVVVESSPQALLARAEIDLVVIPTPNDTHYPLASAALAAGKHVVVDKPFTVTLEQARALKEEAARAGRVLSVFHNRRWDADFLTLKQLLASGELGRVVHFESHFDRYRPEVRARWREQAGSGAGLWYDLGPHLLDQALRLFGVPEAINLDLAMQRDGAQVDDWFHGVLRYGPLRVILHAGMVVPATTPRLLVHGTLGSFVKYGLDRQEEDLKAGKRPPAQDWGVDPVPFELGIWSDGRVVTRKLTCLPGDYPAYYAAMRDAMLGRGPAPVSVDEAIRVMALIELGVRSAAEHREIECAHTLAEA